MFNNFSIKIILFIFILDSAIVIRSTLSKALVKNTLLDTNNEFKKEFKRKEDKMRSFKLILFFDLVKKIENLFADKDFNDKNLSEFLVLHDEILTIFSNGTDLDEEMVHLLLKLLTNSFRQNQIKAASSIVHFRKG